MGSRKHVSMLLHLRFLNGIDLFCHGFDIILFSCGDFHNSRNVPSDVLAGIDLVRSDSQV